jgi:hypothetical protein
MLEVRGANDKRYLVMSSKQCLTDKQISQLFTEILAQGLEHY